LSRGKIGPNSRWFGLWARTSFPRRRDQRFQRRETLFGVLLTLLSPFQAKLALTEQFESQLGELLLHAGHLCLQTNQRLTEIGRWHGGTGQGGRRRRGQSLVCLSGVSREKRGKRATMQGCQLLDLRLGQAFEACICRVRSKLHVGVSEPVA